MTIDFCPSPKAKRGSHDYHPLVPFGDVKAKPDSAVCRNCGKTLSYVTDEPAFPDVEQGQKLPPEDRQ